MGSQTIHYINTPHALDKCLPAIAAAPAFAFDLEFDRDRYTYGFDLCLLQIATPEHCYIIDPLSGLDLEPLFRVFENAEIRKLVHCPGEDLRLLHSLKCYPNNLVDTEVYAKLLNYEQTSLSNMLLQQCGVTLNKKLQTSNWGKRPLTQAQIEYAAADVLYLFELERKLVAEAAAKNMGYMVAEEFELLNEAVYNMEAKENFLKKNDFQFMSPYDQYVLNELFRFRDTLARQRNKPAHQMIPETVLRLLAYRKISISEFANEQGIHPALKTAAFARQLEEKLTDFAQQATEKKLSKRRSDQLITEQERAAYEAKKAELETAKQKVFIPIQQNLSARFGEHAVRFIFSSTLINAILKKENRLVTLRPAYRLMLVMEAAEQMGISLEKWM